MTVAPESVLPVSASLIFPEREISSWAYVTGRIRNRDKIRKTDLIAA
jgi:hypothetical protein